MAGGYTPKRKKLEKEVPTIESVATHNFYCCRCGMAYSRQKGYFPVSHSSLYRGTGYLPICSECVDKMYEQYLIKFGNDKEAIKRVCMKLDLYWNMAIYEMSEKSANTQSRMRSYISKTNLLRFIDKTYDDTIEDEANEAESAESPSFAPESKTAEKDEVNEPEELTISQETIDFWGSGFPSSVYPELERRYSDWTSGMSITDPAERAIYKQICILETTINRDSAQGKPIDKNVNALNNLLGSANLKPNQKKEELDSSVESTPLGVWIRRFENEEPIPEPDEKYKDVDGIIKYVTVWFLGHLGKLVGKKNIYVKMYEEEIARLRVERPEFDEEDDEAFFNDVFVSEQEDSE